MTTTATPPAADQRLRATLPATDATLRNVDAPPPAPDIVDVWGQGSFPASDPPANW
jgi:hypothetical protein